MKGTALFALFLLCAFTSYLPSSTADPIFDTDGHILLNGGTYYVLPVMKGSGGGIELAATGKETCPLTIVQSPGEGLKGKPIRISSPLQILIIHESLPLHFGFSSVPRCAPTPSEWTIVEGLPEGPAVKLTGYNNDLYKIKKASLDFNHYKILFCVRDKCRDIGIHIDDDRNRRLVATENDPLLVQFKKVEESYSAARDATGHED